MLEPVETVFRSGMNKKSDLEKKRKTEKRETGKKKKGRLVGRRRFNRHTLARQMIDALSRQTQGRREKNAQVCF